MTAAGPGSEGPRLAVVAEAPATSSLVREVLATALPGIDASTLDPGATTLALERMACVVIDASIGGESGITMLRRIRAAGYPGGAVLLVDAPANGEISADAAALGARCVARDAIASALGDAVADVLAATEGETGSERVREALRRSQRLAAAGEIALRMQHALNNPLAALLAESQLLAMEPLDPEHQAAVDRIVELCRRVIGIVRRLDGVAGRQCEDVSAREEVPGGEEG